MSILMTSAYNSNILVQYMYSDDNNIFMPSFEFMALPVLFLLL